MTAQGTAAGTITAAGNQPSLVLPGGKIHVPKEGVDHIVVQARDWKRLRSSIERLDKARREFSAAAWASVGIFTSCVLAGAAWHPVYSEMAAETTHTYAYMWPALIVVGIAAAVIAVICFWAAHLTRTDITQGVETLLEDMDGMPLAPVPAQGAN